MNRPCVNIEGIGFVPLALSHEPYPVFETLPPKRVGDDSLVRVNGELMLVRLLRSTGMVKNLTYLVKVSSWPNSLSVKPDRKGVKRG